MRSREKCESVERELAKVELEAVNVKEELVEAKRLTEELTADLREKRRELRQWETDKSKLLVATQKIKVCCQTIFQTVEPEFFEL